MKFLAILSALAIAFAGAEAAKQRVIKGSEAEPHSAPYLVSVRENGTRGYICGGTLVKKEQIVTATHCITELVGMAAVAGLHVRTELDEDTQQRIMDFGKVHEL